MTEVELFSHLILGFETALSLTNLAYCFAGVLLGTAIGVLPGLGPSRRSRSCCR